MNRKVRALGRLKQGEMNRTEAAYAQVLESQKAAGEILDWKFEAVTLVLAKNTRFTPDFMVQLPSGEIQFRETKGFMMDDAWVKLKLAASLFPFAFLLVRKQAKKDGGGWEVTEVPA